MLEQFMNSVYGAPGYVYLNDRLLYIDHVDKNYRYQQVSILPIDAYRYQGNLFGLFKHMGVSPSLHVYAMYLNGYTNPLNYDGAVHTFKIPVHAPIPEY